MQSLEDDEAWLAQLVLDREPIKRKAKRASNGGAALYAWAAPDRRAVSVSPLHPIRGGRSSFPKSGGHHGLGTAPSL
jgi:hypothetical protein